MRRRACRRAAGKAWLDGELLRASERGNGAVVRRLLDQDTGSNACGFLRGGTALAWAAEADQPAVMQLLLDRGADVDRAAPGGTTPLMFTASAKTAGILLRPRASATPVTCTATRRFPARVRGNTAEVALLQRAGAMR